MKKARSRRSFPRRRRSAQKILEDALEEIRDDVKNVVLEAARMWEKSREDGSAQLLAAAVQVMDASERAVDAVYALAVAPRKAPSAPEALALPPG